MRISTVTFVFPFSGLWGAAVNRSALSSVVSPQEARDHKQVIGAEVD